MICYLKQYKMNEIVHKFLLAGNKFMPEMHLRQPIALDKPRFTYSTCGLFTKNIYKNLKKQEIQDIFTTTN